MDRQIQTDKDKQTDNKRQIERDRQMRTYRDKQTDNNRQTQTDKERQKGRFI